MNLNACSSQSGRQCSEVAGMPVGSAMPLPPKKANRYCYGSGVVKAEPGGKTREPVGAEPVGSPLHFKAQIPGGVRGR